MDEAIKALGKDNYFKKLIAKYERPTMEWGGRGGRNVFRALLRAIVYQQLSGKAAATIFARFIALFNKPATPAGKMKFPKSAQVLEMPYEKLRGIGLSNQKVSYVLDLAEKFTDGTIKHKHLHNMTTEEVTAHLTQVKGVGVWTVHMLQIFTLGRLDVLPVGDLAIQKGFKEVYGLKKLPNAKEMEKLAEKWRPHASVASWYLWRHMDNAFKDRGKVKKKAGRR